MFTILGQDSATLELCYLNFIFLILQRKSILKDANSQYVKASKDKGIAPLWRGIGILKTVLLIWG